MRDIRCLFAYSTSRQNELTGEMKRAIAWENEQSARYASTVAICASIVCAVQLARDDNQPSQPSRGLRCGGQCDAGQDDPKESGRTLKHQQGAQAGMDGNSSSKPVDEVIERVDQMLSQLSGLHDFLKDVFEARQAFYEKLILLDGATLTLLFTVVGGLAHASLTNEILKKTGQHLFIGCWFLILSIILSLAHNQLNMATLIHMRGGVALLSARGSRVLLNIALRRAGHEVESLGAVDPEAQKATKRGSSTENWCRWIGVVAQTLTIFAYVEFVASLRTVVLALSGVTR